MCCLKEVFFGLVPVVACILVKSTPSLLIFTISMFCENWLLSCVQVAFAVFLELHSNFLIGFTAVCLAEAVTQI